MATVKFYLNHPFKKGTTTLRTDEVSIDLMLTVTRAQRFRIPTGERIQPKYWDKKEKQVKSNYRGSLEVNQQLSIIKQSALEQWRKHKTAALNDLKKLVQAVIQGESTEEKKTVIDAVRLFIAQYSREKEAGTVKRYRGLLKKLESFNPMITFEQLDFNFYDAFKKFLYANPNSVYNGYRMDYDSVSGTYIVAPIAVDSNLPSNIGLFDDTVFKYFINLKTVCAWAEKRGYTIHHAHKTWEIIKREYPPISLTKDELEKIERLTLQEKHLDIARDFLVLECRTGQRISDLRRFHKDHIEGVRWTFTQKKGNRLKSKTITLPLVGYCAPALLILQKYNYELPRISEQNLNIHIKTVCQQAGIDDQIFIERYAGSKKVRIPGRKNEFISTHTGRKTFITLTLQSKAFSTRQVMDITGITSEKTLRHYYAGSSIESIESALIAMEPGKAIMKAG